MVVSSSCERELLRILSGACQCWSMMVHTGWSEELSFKTGKSCWFRMAHHGWCACACHWQEGCGFFFVVHKLAPFVGFQHILTSAAGAALFVMVTTLMASLEWIARICSLVVNNYYLMLTDGWKWLTTILFDLGDLQCVKQSMGCLIVNSS